MVMAMDKEKTNIIFSTKLRNLREHQEFSQKQAAERLNIAPATYSRYERGVREPDFNTLKRIANFFHVSIDYLLGNEDEIALETAPILEFDKLIMNGNYTINQRFPNESERRTIRDVVQAIYQNKE